MNVFAGFPSGRVRYTPVPNLFFSDLLASIDNLDELKLTLYLFWALYHQKGSPRYVTLAELEKEGSLLSGLSGADGEARIAALHAAADKGAQRGTILRLDVANADGTTRYLFLNTPQARSAIREVKAGTLVLESEGRPVEAHIPQERPSIFALYEQNIGLLTPLISERLKDASETYPDTWIQEAVTIAVERNARNWRYIVAILRRWEAEGKH